MKAAGITQKKHRGLAEAYKAAAERLGTQNGDAAQGELLAETNAGRYTR